MLNVGDGFGRVKAFWAGLRAIHDRVTTVQFERVIQLVQTIFADLVSAINDPTICVQQGSWA